MHTQTQVLEGSLLVNLFAGAHERVMFYPHFTLGRQRSVGSRGPVLVTVLADSLTRARLRQSLHVCLLQVLTPERLLLLTGVPGAASTQPERAF